MSPSIAPKALGKTTLNCVSSTSSIDERHSPAIVSSSGASWRTASSACRCFSAIARHEPPRGLAHLFLLGDHFGEVFDHPLAGERFDLFFQLGLGLAEGDGRLVEFFNRLGLVARRRLWACPPPSPLQAPPIDWHAPPTAPAAGAA